MDTKLPEAGENYAGSVMSEKLNESGPSDVAPITHLPWTGYDKFFSFVCEKGNNIIVNCFLCQPMVNFLSAAKNSSANLKRHLQRQHPLHIKNLETQQSSKKRLLAEDFKRKRVILENEVPLKKPFSLEAWNFDNELVSQDILDKKIIDFVIEQAMPLQIVEKQTFVDLVRLGLPKDLIIMGPETLREKIEVKVQDLQEEISKKIDHVDYVSTTADCWTHGRRSYLAVTAHWIDPQTLKRDFSVLACRHVIGCHTPEVLARELYDVYSRYKIQNKVTFTTTDNGSNFVNAFRICGTDSIIVDPMDVNIKDQVDQDDVQYFDLDEILNTHGKPDKDMRLTPHRRCASHTLTLVATQDAESAIVSNSSFKKLYRSLFAKCEKLWWKQNQCPQTADFIRKVFSELLKVPKTTLWNSTYESFKKIQQLLATDSEKMNSILDFCSLPRFTSPEIQLMNEYCEVMGPVAHSLHILQAETGMYLGYLLPTLYALDKKLEARERKPMSHCLPLLQALRSGIKKRFGPIWMEKELVLAACLHPRFKLDWLDGLYRYTAEAWLKGVIQDGDSVATRDIEEEEEEDDDFFCLPSGSRKAVDSADEELSNFLSVNNSRDLKLLHVFPRILKNFIAYNTAMPSGAALERLLSSDRNEVKRHVLTENMFENLVLLKTNKSL